MLKFIISKNLTFFNSFNKIKFYIGFDTVHDLFEHLYICKKYEFLKKGMYAKQCKLFFQLLISCFRLVLVKTTSAYWCVYIHLKLNYLMVA